MPELIEQLAERLGIQVRVQGGLRLIRLQDCHSLIEACKSQKVLILGIEGFTITKGRVCPDMDMIADFSALATKTWDVACLDAAHSATIYFESTKGREDMFFDFSLQGRQK
jgi:hypothetical protein